MNKIQLTIQQIGFIKAIGVVVITAILSYLGNAAHLNGVLSPVLASLVAALAASLESHFKDASGNTEALFGAVTVK